MNALAQLQRPQSITLDLQTRTPLYTGGVGQYGDQIHPSSILGGLRKFSCLLAAAVGDAAFEHTVWGTPGDAKEHRAKQVALQIDTRDLKPLKGVKLQYNINWRRADNTDREGWYYNVARTGALHLTITRVGISETHWQLLLLALRIQIRHAAFGSRDQWGLGVLHTDTLPDVAPLTQANSSLKDTPNLRDAFFAEVRFEKPAPPHWETALEQGLRWRETLRNSFRAPGEDDLRHYLFGHLGQWGSAINFSALYKLNEKQCALRIWGVVPHTQPANPIVKDAGQIRKRLHEAVHRGANDGAWSNLCHVVWEGGRMTQNFAHWINQRAGVLI